MEFEDMTPEEQERAVIAELVSRFELFADAGRSSMTIRLSEVEILLRHAVAALSPACPHAWEEMNPGMWICKEMCGAEANVRNSPDWAPPVEPMPEPADLPRMWWKPADDKGPACLSVEVAGGPKTYRRHWDFAGQEEKTEWGWVVADTAIRLTATGSGVLDRAKVREEIRAGINSALSNGGHPKSHTGWSPSAEVERVTAAVMELLNRSDS